MLSLAHLKWLMQKEIDLKRKKQFPYVGAGNPLINRFVMEHTRKLTLIVHHEYKKGQPPSHSCVMWQRLSLQSIKVDLTVQKLTPGFSYLITVIVPFFVVNLIRFSPSPMTVSQLDSPKTVTFPLSTLASMIAFVGFFSVCMLILPLSVSTSMERSKSRVTSD